jgi:hypothetical protein
MNTVLDAALRSISTDGLLRAAFALTHQIHEYQESGVGEITQGRIDDCRAQRDIIVGEVKRRTGDA